MKEKRNKREQPPSDIPSHLNSSRKFRSRTVTCENDTMNQLRMMCFFWRKWNITWFRISFSSYTQLLRPIKRMLSGCHSEPCSKVTLLCQSPRASLLIEPSVLNMSSQELVMLCPIILPVHLHLLLAPLSVFQISIHSLANVFTPPWSPVLACPVLACPVLACPVLACPALACPALACPALVPAAYSSSVFTSAPKRWQKMNSSD